MNSHICLRDDLSGEDVATQNLAQREAGRARSLLLDGLLGNHFLERSLRGFGCWELPAAVLLLSRVLASGFSVSCSFSFA